MCRKLVSDSLLGNSSREDGDWQLEGTRLSKSAPHTRNRQVLCLWKSPHSSPLTLRTPVSTFWFFDPYTSPCFADLAGLVDPETLLAQSLPRLEFFNGEKKRRERAGGKVPDGSPSPLLLSKPVAHLHLPCWVLGVPHLKPGPAPPSTAAFPSSRCLQLPDAMLSVGMLFLSGGCKTIALVNQIMDPSSNGHLTGGPESACGHLRLQQRCVLKMGWCRQPPPPHCLMCYSCLSSSQDAALREPDPTGLNPASVTFRLCDRG